MHVASYVISALDHSEATDRYKHRISLVEILQLYIFVDMHAECH